MKIEINIGAVKRLIAVGLFVLTVSGCGSEKKSEVVSPIKMVEENKTDQFDEIKFDLWKTSEDYDIVEFPDRKKLELCGMDYALLVDTYEKNADGSWEKIVGEPTPLYVQDGVETFWSKAEVGTEKIDYLNDGRFKDVVVGWVIIPAEITKENGEWKKYISDSKMYYEDPIYRSTVWREVPVSNEKDKLDAINSSEITFDEDNKKLVKVNS